MLNTTLNSNLTHTPAIAPSLLSDDAFCEDWAQLTHTDNNHNPSQLPIVVDHYINAKGLACPMPLLKLKMVLKQMTQGDTVYLTATDGNSEHDIAAFCQHLGHSLLIITHQSQLGKNSDTIFHLFITKNC